MRTSQAGFEREIGVVVEVGTVVQFKPNRHPRERWTEASRAIAAAGDDALVWPEFGNESDAKLIW